MAAAALSKLLSSLLLQPPPPPQQEFTLPPRVPLPKPSPPSPLVASSAPSAENVAFPSLANSNVLFFSSAGFNAQVTVQDNEPEEWLLNRFRREVIRAGVFRECKKRRFFENNQDKKKRRGAISKKKKKRKARQAARRNKNNPQRFDLSDFRLLFDDSDIAFWVCFLMMFILFNTNY